MSAPVKPFIKPRPATPPAAAPASPAKPRISPNELTIFSVASSVADPKERSAFLERACGTDTELRERLEERLRARTQQAPGGTPAAPTPTAPAAPSTQELAVSSRENALAAMNRPEAMALVPMSASQLAAVHPPRHSPVPWAAATILAIAVGALAVFFMTERKTRELAEQDALTAAEGRSKAEKERDAAAAVALESKTAAQRADQARQAALQEKDAFAGDAAKARTEAAERLTAADKAAADLKLANEKAKVAEAEVAKLRTDSAAGLRATQIALADSLARLGAAQMDTRAYNEAETNLRQALDWRVKLQVDPWSIVENRALLGTALMQRSQDAGALQEMQTAAAAFETLGPPANDADRARASAASKRIVQFFTVTGRRRDATEWRKRLDAVLAVR